MEYSLAHDLFVIWLFGMVVAFFLNLVYCEGDLSISRGTFNVVMWPLAILILYIKGCLEHFKREQ